MPTFKKILPSSLSTSDKALIHTLSWAAGDAYRAELHLTKESGGFTSAFGEHYQVFKRYTVDGEFALTIFKSRSDDSYILAFKGTSSSLDALVDGEAESVHPPFAIEGVEVHRGFLEYYNRFHESIWADLTPLNISQLYVTGHSMGSAISTLFCYDSYYNHPDLSSKIRHINFASPRVGNKAFAEDYIAKDGDKTLRIINYLDIVPDVPTNVLGFYHTATACYFYFHYSDDVFIEIADKEWSAFSHLLHPKEALGNAIVFRHSMYSYFQVFNAFMNNEYHPETKEEVKQTYHYNPTVDIDGPEAAADSYTLCMNQVPDTEAESAHVLEELSEFLEKIDFLPSVEELIKWVLKDKYRIS